MELEPVKEYTVNPKAESLLNVCLTVLLVLGWIVAIAAIAVSVYYAIENEAYIFIGAGILGAAIILFLFYYIWATYKLFINMSRNLFNINEQLKNRKV